MRARVTRKPIANMRVRVTRKHITNGCRDDQTSCPIALALIDLGCTFASEEEGVNFSEVKFIDKKGHDWNVDLPQDAIDFVDAFDLGEVVKPFEFTLKVPKK